MFVHCLPHYRIARQFNMFGYFTQYQAWINAGFNTEPSKIFCGRLHEWILRMRTQPRLCMAMALHPRIGDPSQLNMLPLDTIRLIMDFHCPVDVDMDAGTMRRLMRA